MKRLVRILAVLAAVEKKFANLAVEHGRRGLGWLAVEEEPDFAFCAAVGAGFVGEFEVTG